MKCLIPYVLALLAVGGVAIAQQPSFVTPALSPEQPTQPNEAPRHLTINVTITDPDDLKVTEGDRITVGQLIADRTRDRNRLEAQLPTAHTNLLSYQQQWANYEQRLRDRKYQVAQTQLKLDEVEHAIATLSVIRSPYAGRIRRVKWLGQGTDGMLSAEITLMVRPSDGRGFTVPE